MQKNTLITAVAATLLAVPASQAAIDDAGMQYTSAAEGFYGSLRLGFRSEDSGGGDKQGIGDLGSPSRLGVRGTADLGGGLTATYRYEFSVNADNGARDVKNNSEDDNGIGNTRLNQVGLNGGFGSILLGTQWSLDYNNVWGTTDVFNSQGGNLAYNNEGLSGRQSNAITYTSPNFNGFTFGASAVLDTERLTDKDSSGDRSEVTIIRREGDGAATIDTAVGTNNVAVVTMFATDDGADNTADTADDLVGDAAVAGFADALSGEADTIDKIVLAAGYSQAGFDVAGTYVRQASTTDITVTGFNNIANPALDSVRVVRRDYNPVTYGVAFGYGQDNWSLDYWYARTDHDNRTTNQEDTHHSLAGQLEVGKTTLRALWESRTIEMRERQDADSDHWTLGIQYDLGSRARVFAEYENDEVETVSNLNAKSKSDTDIFVVGYRVDF